MTLPDPSFRYTWLIWAAAFMLPWALLFIARPPLRRPMLWASALTAPFGLTEPLFVPAYWNPPTLFASPCSRAQRRPCFAARTCGATRSLAGPFFFALYAVFLLGLKWLWPGYIAAVWNLDALVAWRPWGLPMEELLFGFAFGTYWGGVYEHLTWRQPARRLVVEMGIGKKPI